MSQGARAPSGFPNLADLRRAPSPTGRPAPRVAVAAQPRIEVKAEFGPHQLMTTRVLSRPERVSMPTAFGGTSPAAERGTHSRTGRPPTWGGFDTRCWRYSTRRPRITEPGGWGRLRRRQAEPACAAERQRGEALINTGAARRGGDCYPRAAGSIPTPPRRSGRHLGVHRRPRGASIRRRPADSPRGGGRRRLPPRGGGRSGGYSPRGGWAPGGY